MKNIESTTQQACVRWFRLQYSCYNYLLFAIPNGGKRGIATATIMKKEGVLAGVADLFLSVPKLTLNESESKHGLYIEMKIAKGKQKERQKEFQKAVELAGYQYSICRSVGEFISVIEEYL